MKIIAQSGKEIDLEPWAEQMRENVRNKCDVLEATPIGKTAAGGYFWWDEKANPPLEKKSVTKLIRSLISEKELVK